MSDQDKFIAFLEERIITASSVITKAAYRIVLRKFKEIYKLN